MKRFFDRLNEPQLTGAATTLPSDPPAVPKHDDHLTSTDADLPLRKRARTIGD